MLQITSLRADERVTPEGNLWLQEVPFLTINATFRITDDEHLLERTKADSEDYRQTLTIDNPERLESFLLNVCGFEQFMYDGYKMTWTHNDPIFVYLEKFQTFWFRQFIADSPVTRAILSEIRHFKEHGSLPSVYRHAEEYIIISLFACLDRYWD
jgi:hypothetical protein